MERVRVAVPTKGYAGLNNTISDVFSRANTFTIVEVESGKIVSSTSP